MQDPEDFLVYRHAEGDPDGPLQWLRMRKGIADLYRRAEVSQKVNSRYLNALASVDDSTSSCDCLDRWNILSGTRKNAGGHCIPLTPRTGACWHAISASRFASREGNRCAAC